MYELIYTGFFFVLVLEVLLFVFLSLPTPRGWKHKITSFLTHNKSVKNIIRVHLGLCILAGIFLLDSYNQQNGFRIDKKALKKKDSMASQLKSSFLSFMILKVERNQYIAFMLIYTSLALNFYLWILQYLYNKRQIIEAQNPNLVQNQDFRLSYH